MPIYEYECVDPKKACEKCVNRFEIIHAKVSEEPLTVCPSCGQSVKKVISWCRAAIVEASAEDQRGGEKISDYERQECGVTRQNLQTVTLKRSGINL